MRSLLRAACPSILAIAIFVSCNSASVTSEVTPQENPPASILVPCEAADDCASGNLCVNGECVDQGDGTACSAENPNGACGDGFACVNGECVEAPKGPGDTDGDGVTDDVDNCVRVVNPEQEDTYGDPELGDACDLSDPLQSCIKHAKWWKIDDYEKWRRDPVAYGVPCTKYVGNSVRVTQPDGSEERPYSTIQDAVNVARAGDVICIKPGVYHEHYYESTGKFIDNVSTPYHIDDDFTGLVVNHGGEVDNPIVIAALGDRDSVVLDGEKKRDAGIRISNNKGVDCYSRLIPDPRIPNRAPVQFLEIHGLTVKNYTMAGVDSHGSCILLADSHIHHNGNVWPAMLKLRVSGDNSTWGLYNKVDDDGDGLVDESDEYRENLEVAGRNNVGDEICTRGNIYRNNDIHDSGIWYQYGDCADVNDPGCPDEWGLERCKTKPAGSEYGGTVVKGSGMYLRGNDILVEGNKIHDNVSSIHLNGSDYDSGNKVLNNEIYRSGAGIGCEMNSGRVIERNYIHDVGVCKQYPYNVSSALYINPPSPITRYIPGIKNIVRNNRFENNAAFDIWWQSYCNSDTRPCPADLIVCPEVVIEGNTFVVDGSRVPVNYQKYLPFFDMLCGKEISLERNTVTGP